MDFSIQTSDRPTHVSRTPSPGVASKAASTPSTAAAPTDTQTQTAAAPSFSAVFAQIAASAAAAGTTVASTAGGAASAAGTPTAATSSTGTTAGSTNSGAATDPFGANPWLANPTGNGPDNSVTQYNPIYFATQQTAQTVAQMVGGSVVQTEGITSAPGSPFQQNQLNYMVQLPNGGQINPGLVADMYTHGWNQSFVDQQVSNEVAGAAPASPVAT